MVEIVTGEGYTYDPSSQPPPFGHPLKKFWAFEKGYVNLNHGEFVTLSASSVLGHLFQARMDRSLYLSSPKQSRSCCKRNRIQITSIVERTCHSLSNPGMSIPGHLLNCQADCGMQTSNIRAHRRQTQRGGPGPERYPWTEHSAEKYRVERGRCATWQCVAV